MPAATLLGHNIGGISPLGGGWIYLAVWSGNPNSGGTIGAWQPFGYVKDSTLNDSNPLKEMVDERGAMIAGVPEGRKVMIEGVSYSTDLTNLILPTILAANQTSVATAGGTGVATGAGWTPEIGNFYAFIKQMNYAPNNNATAPDSIFKYLFAPIVQVDQVLKLKQLGNEVPFKFIVDFNEVAISNSTWTGTSGFSSAALANATITVPPGVMYNWWTAIS